MTTSGRWEVLDIKPGTICKDFDEYGIRILVVRGPSHLCAYVGIAEDHPLAGFHYDDIPLSCHGGLTFGRLGDGGTWPKGCYWYGWDYGHCNDAVDYYFTSDTSPSMYLREHGKRWTVAEVEAEARDVAWDFRKLALFTERIHAQRCPGQTALEAPK